MPTKKLQQRKGEEGSAMTEAAIIIPVLVLLVWWSSAMTDVMVLKIKAQEAARFALWEMTVFRTPAQIQADVQTRFADLKSPASVNTTQTDLMLYPKSGDLNWNVQINPRYQRVTFGQGLHLPTNGGLGSIITWVDIMENAFAATVDTAVSAENFNTYGSGSVYVSLGATHNGSIILNGGDLGTHLSGGTDMAAGPLQNLLFSAPLASERPMRLVYDSWKAWPKPAMYTTNHGSGALTDPTVSPKQTYQVVDSMVAQQVNQIAFFGLNSISVFDSLNNFMGTLLDNGFSQAVLGGEAPTFFATGPMDHALGSVNGSGMPSSRSFNIGPVTILPVAAPDAAFVPGANLFTNRIGDIGSSGTNVTSVDEYSGMGAGSDQSRYTVPYRINTKYWTKDGGTGADTFGPQVSAVPAALATNNKYVQAFGCRGHYFGGAKNAQVTDPTKRFTLACPY